MTFSTHFYETVSSLVEALSEITKNNIKYKNTFSKEIQLGISTFQSGNKEMVSEYFLFSASLSKTVFSLEKALAKMYGIMSEADKNGNLNEISACDDILKKYNSYKKDLCEFLQKSEKIIANSPQEPSSHKLFAYLTDFERKTFLFISFLNTLKN